MSSSSSADRLLTVATSSIGAIALAVLVATVLFTLGLTEPEAPGLSPVQRWASNLALALIGWLFGTGGIILHAISDSDFWPPVPETLAVAGAAILLIANGVFIRDIGATLVLRSLGYAVLGALAVFLPIALHKSPWADYREPDSDSDSDSGNGGGL